MKILLLLLPLMACSKYQVVQEVKVNLYHLQNPRTKDVKIVVTKDYLVIGGWYRLKQINIIELEKDNK